jgi:penicillin-binding protein 2
MRERLLRGVIYSFLALLAAALSYNQVIRYDYYSRLSNNNAIRILPIEGPRGKIFDRNGVVLVTNRLSFDVAVVYQELKDKAGLVDTLSSTLEIPAAEIKSALESAAKKPYVPVTIVEDIAKEKAFILEEASFNLRGLVIETRALRHYVYGSTGAHLFGYLSEINEEELERLRDYGYRMKDLIGRSGLERYYNTYLTGVDGGLQIEIDSRGRQTRVLGLKEPSSGKNLYLTIDAELQRLSDKLMEGKAGAIIVMNPNTGEVLAITSHPSFDPNIFVKRRASAEKRMIVNDKTGKPLLNRAISGLYPPGSVFKIVTASSALEAGKITNFTPAFCSGSYQLGNAKFDCWKESGHGTQTITDALMNSCNVFFYHTGRATGVDNLESCAKLFGFGRPTGIDLPDETSGLVPGRSWKRLHRKDAWYDGETLNFAIGQGYLLVTPIQILQMISVMANKGSIVKPYIVKRIDTTPVAGSGKKNIGLKESTIRIVREGLYKVINSDTGTGRRARMEGVLVAGKTGTAQNPQGRTHAWFAGFAPYENAKIALVVFLEHGGKGGVEPAEIARTLFEEAKKRGYF